MGKEFTHFDREGNAVMVDVSEKPVTQRSALARETISVTREIIDAIQNHTVMKGDVLGVARIAGIMGVKQTASLIPMCHTLLIQKCSVDFQVDEKTCQIHAFCRVKTEGKTGVEMEALTGVTTALLTIYDMCKAIDKGMVLGEICLVEKIGGKSGPIHYEIPNSSEPRR